MDMIGLSLASNKRYIFINYLFVFSNFNIFLFNDFKSIQGLTNVINHLAPHAKHRNCAKHIWANWKKTHKGEKFRKLFWNATYYTHETDFKRKIKEMKEESEAAHDEFIARELRLFCKAFMTQLPR